MRQHCLGVTEIVQDAAASIQEESAFFRQRNAARGPVKQTHAKRLFKPGDALSDRRRRDAELRSRSHEAQRFRCPDECDNSRQTFHPPILRNFSPLSTDLRGRLWRFDFSLEQQVQLVAPTDPLGGAQQIQKGERARMRTATTTAQGEGKIPILAAVCLAALVLPLRFSGGAIATRAIGCEFGSGAAALNWITNAFMLTFGSLLMAACALADQFGRKRVFTSASGCSW